MEKDRKPNLIDAYRLLAAFCVVWYHSNFLPVHPWWRDLFISWSMPFFYLTAAYFSMNSLLKDSSFVKVAKRILRILSLLIVYGLVFESMRLYLYFVGQVETYDLFLNNVLFWIRSGSNSPLYFLFDLIIYTLLAALIARVVGSKKTKRLMAISLIVLLILVLRGFPPVFSEINIWLWWMNQKWALYGLTFGFAFALWGLPVQIQKERELSTPKSLLFIVIPFFIPPPFIGLLLLLGSYYSWIESKLLERVSYWGQRYALGVYLWHPIVIAFLDNTVPKIISNNLLAYVGINLLGFLGALGVTKLLVKKFPYFVTIR